ncbi:MAG: NFACT RNA binding domain-containing protein [Nanoarchaeota archaeon]|nr:DUF814 domain-containing protein [Nanoarchaeota archaeon]
MQQQIDYPKHRWFFTSSKKLVVGGKSSDQNDELLKKLKRGKKDYVAMHTSSPGSPFAVIISDKKDISKQDIEETAIFTGCFSRAWKQGKKKTSVDIFSTSQIYKTKKMKVGTWGVKGKIKRQSVPLELVLTKQENKLRAVPEFVVKNKKDILLKIRPGKIDKQEMLPKFQILLNESFSQEELLSALPSGGVTIVKR